MALTSYVVIIECRIRGAIGEFGMCQFTVSAADAETARELAFNEAQKLDYETRFITKTEIV